MHRKKSVFGIQAAATIIGMIVLGTLLLFWAYLLPTGRSFMDINVHSWIIIRMV